MWIAAYLRKYIYKIPNKNLQALLLGYVLFKMDGFYFFRYSTARKLRVKYSELGLPIVFEGWNIFLRGWLGFYYSNGNGILVPRQKDPS